MFTQLFLDLLCFDAYKILRYIKPALVCTCYLTNRSKPFYFVFIISIYYPCLSVPVFYLVLQLSIHPLRGKASISIFLNVSISIFLNGFFAQNRVPEAITVRTKSTNKLYKETHFRFLSPVFRRPEGECLAQNRCLESPNS